jgi:hypothetical protein
MECIGPARSGSTGNGCARAALRSPRLRASQRPPIPARKNSSVREYLDTQHTHEVWIAPVTGSEREREGASAAASQGNIVPRPGSRMATDA